MTRQYQKASSLQDSLFTLVKPRFFLTTSTQTGKLLPFSPAYALLIILKMFQINIPYWYKARHNLSIVFYSHEVNLSVRQSGFTIYRSYKPEKAHSNCLRVRMYRSNRCIQSSCQGGQVVNYGNRVFFKPVGRCSYSSLPQGG